MTENDELAAVVGRVDTDAVARDMIALFQSEIAAYREVGEVGLAEIADINRRSLHGFYELLVRGSGPTTPELELVRDSARRWAIFGRPLEDLLRGYRLGTQRAWDALIAAADAGEQAILLPLVGRVMEYIDIVSGALTSAYHDERRHASAEEERRVHRLFDRLLDGGALDRPAAASAEQLGFPITERYVPFGISLPDSLPHGAARAAASLRRKGVLAVSQGDRVAGMTPAGGEHPPVDDPGWLVALGDPVPRPALRGALDDLRLVLQVARRRGMRGTIGPEACFPELLLARSPDVAAALRRRVLMPVEAYAARRSSELVETLTAFVECDLDRRRAAARLGIHRNTLDYRLKRIEELNGLRFGRPNDLILIVLALKVAAVDDADGAAPTHAEPATGH